MLISIIVIIVWYALMGMMLVYMNHTKNKPNKYLKEAMDREEKRYNEFKKIVEIDLIKERIK